MISQLIATAVGEGHADSLDRLLPTITPADTQHLQAWQLGALGSLLDGLERKNLSLTAIAYGNNDALKRCNLVFDWANKLAKDSTAKDALREPAIRLLGRRPEHESAELDELAGLLETLPADESRTRWHLGLVVPRVAHTQAQRLRAARMMSLLAGDESNVVRCSAVEGLGLLALQEPSLRNDAEEMVERYLREGTTKAMKSSARRVLRMWASRKK